MTPAWPCYDERWTDILEEAIENGLSDEDIIQKYNIDNHIILQQMLTSFKLDEEDSCIELTLFKL